MAWQFRRRIKIAPGVRINLSKGGVSTSFGVRGANVTVGKKGAYLNTGIPGTGLYNRQRIGKKGTTKNINFNNSATNTQSNKKHNGCGIITLIGILILFIFLFNRGSENIFFPLILGTICLVVADFTIISLLELLFSKNKSSNAVALVDAEIKSAREELNKSSKQTIKKEILVSYISSLEIERQIHIKDTSVKKIQKSSRRNSSKNLLQVKSLENEIEGLKLNYFSKLYNVFEPLTEAEKEKFIDMINGFSEMANSRKVWINRDTISSFFQPIIGVNSNNSQQNEIVLQTGCYSGISNEMEVPILPDNQGSVFYLYPNFILKASSSTKFEILPINTLQISGHSKTFYESNAPPSDSEIVSMTYRHTNKDGGPDRRYSNNPTIYSVIYYELNLPEYKLNYQISNVTTAETFVSRFRNYLSIVNGENYDDSSVNLVSNNRIQKDIYAFSNLSEKQFHLIKGFTSSLFNTINHLQNDKELFKNLKLNDEKNSDITETIKFLVLLDLIKVATFISDKISKENCQERREFGLIAGSILNEDIKEYLDLEYEVFTKIFDWEILNNTVEALLEFGKVENPIKIQAFSKSDATKDLVKKQNLLALPVFLKINDSNLLDEYAAILYQFANIMAKVDNTVTKEEEVLLNKIYEVTHKPEVDVGESNTNTKIKMPANDDETLEDVLNELHGLIGLSDVKEQIVSFMNFIKIQNARKEAGLKSTSLSNHVVFTGNPGTGKTTVARILARIYKLLGLVEKGHLVETDRSGLIAEYTGQTAVKVNKVVDAALDGVLFIDEAYALMGGNKDDFGKEAVATLIKRMEDDRNRLIVILAGYTEEMNSFIETNPGFKSRFNRFIEFPDYNKDELIQIFESKCIKLEYHLSEGAKDKVSRLFEKAYSERDRTFGNGRYARNVFEKTLENQANRIAKEVNLTEEILTQIIEEDINY